MVYCISALTINMVGVFFVYCIMENKEEPKESQGILLFKVIISIAAVAYGIYLMC